MILTRCSESVVRSEMYWTDLLAETGSKAPCSLPNNTKCKIRSDFCSEEMNSEHDDLCLFHSMRMATVEEINCGCSSHVVLCGDATGRILYLHYRSLNSDDIAMVDSTGRLYCCGTCQNTDDYVTECGGMRVCAAHEAAHSHMTDNEYQRRVHL
jgi:hypothetical protein